MTLRKPRPHPPDPHAVLAAILTDPYLTVAEAEHLARRVRPYPLSTARPRKQVRTLRSGSGRTRDQMCQCGA